MKIKWKEAFAHGYINWFIILTFTVFPSLILFLYMLDPPTQPRMATLYIGLLIFLWFVFGPIIVGIIIKSAVKDITKSREKKTKYVNQKMVAKKNRQHSIFFMVSISVIALGLFLTFRFDEAFWMGAKLGFLFGYLGIAILVFGHVVVLKWYYNRKNYQFHKQLIEKNIKVKDLQHFKELKQSFGPKTRRN